MIKIFTEMLLIGMPIIAWRMGVISLSRLSDAMIVLGVLGTVIVVLSLSGIRVPIGNIAQLSSLKEIGAIENAGSRGNALYWLQIVIITVVPLAAGFLIRLYS